MTKDAGAKLGPCEIVAQIGAGGMGEVYRPCELRVSRDDVTIQRWQQLTGKQAALEGDGRTLEENRA